MLENKKKCPLDGAEQKVGWSERRAQYYFLSFFFFFTVFFDITRFLSITQI